MSIIEPKGAVPLKWSTDDPLAWLATMVAFAMCFSTRATAWELDTSLSHAGASFLGPRSEYYAGSKVTGVGDVNGDGYADLLIGAYGLDQGGPIYLVLGKATGWSTGVSLSTADASFVGETEGDVWGMTFGEAGDVDGDGLDDFLVSAPYNDESGDMAGQVYLILGQPGGWMPGTSLATADASFLGEGTWDKFGTGLAGGGDVDGDGFDDFLLGAPSNCDGGTQAGKAYLVLGRGSGWDIDAPGALADGAMVGTDSDAAGYTLAIPGDLDGDGYADIAIGGAKAYLVYGRTWTSTSVTDLASADATFIGEEEEDAAGSVAAAGDLNGDGYDDLLVGAYRSDDGGTDAGQVYLLLGRPHRWSGVASLAMADASFVGEAPLDWLGSMGDAGDLNGDGYDDLLMGASKHDEGAPDAGEVYLFLGRASGWGLDTHLQYADGSFWGEFSGDGAGVSVAGAGDVDGDGVDEFLVGASCNDEAAKEAGKVYLFTEPYPTDGDGDGWAAEEGDCRDDDAAINPGVDEDCADGLDNDCDGAVDSDDDACRGGDDTAVVDTSTEDSVGADTGNEDTQGSSPRDTAGVGDDDQTATEDESRTCGCGAPGILGTGWASLATAAHLLLRRRRYRGGAVGFRAGR